MLLVRSHCSVDGEYPGGTQETLVTLGWPPVNHRVALGLTLLICKTKSVREVLASS